MKTTEYTLLVTQQYGFHIFLPAVILRAKMLELLIMPQF
jgi:hypothetical protein